MEQMKDDALAILAARANVAQFVSFEPGPSLRQRHSCIGGYELDHEFVAPSEAIAELLRVAGSVNVRTFTRENPKSGPFDYGLRAVEPALAAVERYAAEGRYTIVNETVDVDDGGISGVSLGGVIEFAPGDTPRAVEKPGIARFAASML